MVGSGEVLISRALESARYELGQEAAPSSLGSLSNYTSTAHPNTAKTIQGWAWDKTVWADAEFDNRVGFIPSNWDPTTSGINELLFQPGIGSNRDLELLGVDLVTSSGVNELGLHRPWAPRVNHGYYYDFEEERYLFSDDSEYYNLTYSGLATDTGASTAGVSGFNMVTLSGRPKVGTPILARRYEWNDLDGKYDVALQPRKKIEFTGELVDYSELNTYDTNSGIYLWDNIDQDQDEFVLVYDEDPPRLIFNRQYVEEIGTDVTPGGLEVLGITRGDPDEQLRLRYSPVDSAQPINIYTYLTDAGPFTQWEVIDFDEDPVGNQVRCDYDKGLIAFGDASEGETVPAAGSTVGANYWAGVQVEFEPEDTNDGILAIDTNINPVYRHGSQGFVNLSTRLEDPASITLTARLPLIQLNVYGPQYVGNTVSLLTAEVKDRRGQLLEAQTVTFFINSIPSVGSFGGVSQTEITSVTDENGEARSFYNSPKGINEIGEMVTASGWATESSPSEYPSASDVVKLHTDSLLIEGELTDMFLYRVDIDDQMVGWLDITKNINSLQIQTHAAYEEFFNDESIFGQTGVDDVSLEATQAASDWEADRRLLWDFPQPEIFSLAVGNGKKRLMSAWNANALNPHTMAAGAYAPVQPIGLESGGPSEYDLVFDTTVNSIPKPTASDSTPSGTHFAYFVVVPTIVKIQASVFNERLNRVVLSNEISIKINVPPYLSGLWIMDEINQGHINEISSNLATITASGQHVPLGFRLRSTNVTLAAALDGVTFLDVNPEYNYDPYDSETITDKVSIHHQVNVNTIV